MLHTSEWASLCSSRFQSAVHLTFSDLNGLLCFLLLLWFDTNRKVFALISYFYGVKVLTKKEEKRSVNGCFVVQFTRSGPDARQRCCKRQLFQMGTEMRYKRTINKKRRRMNSQDCKTASVWSWSLRSWVQHIQDIFLLSGFIYSNISNQAKWSHEGGYQLDESTQLVCVKQEKSCVQI